jgi:hypothetical protein
MLISTAMLSEVILAERRLDEMPARQERRRLARLAAEARAAAGYPSWAG